MAAGKYLCDDKIFVCDVPTCADNEDHNSRGNIWDLKWKLDLILAAKLANKIQNVRKQKHTLNYWDERHSFSQWIDLWCLFIGAGCVHSKAQSALNFEKKLKEYPSFCAR